MKRQRKQQPPPQWWSWDWDGRLLSGPPGGPSTPHTGPVHLQDGPIVWYRDGFPCEPPTRRLRPVEHVGWRLEEVDEVEEEALTL